MGVATFKVSDCLLRDMLFLPEGTEFLGPDGYPARDVSFTVGHPDLKDGEALPHYARDSDGRTIFVGWGQD